jgi:cysteine synthase
VGLALAAAIKGYRCIFTIPDKMSQEKVRLLKAFGAEVIVTPTAVPPDHPDDYVMTARRIAKETPNAILANQFYNQANPEAHYATTGPEIWEQTDGRITHFVASAGTGGTISGTGQVPQGAEPRYSGHRRDPVGSRWPSTGARERRRRAAVPGGGDRQREDPRYALVRHDRPVRERARPGRLPPWPAASPARRGSSWAAPPG